MVKDGVERLTEMQCSDGGWGWFSGWGEHSDAHTTALVVHGLQIAKRNDVALVPGVLERGIEWLKRYQAEQVQLIKNAAIKDKPQDLRWKDFADNLDAFVYMVLADAARRTPRCSIFSTATAPTWPSTAWPCTASRWTSRAKRKSWP